MEKHLRQNYIENFKTKQARPFSSLEAFIDPIL